MCLQSIVTNATDRWWTARSLGGCCALFILVCRLHVTTSHGLKDAAKAQAFGITMFLKRVCQKLVHERTIHQEA